MEKEDKEIDIKQLCALNIPFVVFREPGGTAQCVIQNSPLNNTETLDIKVRGFYLFPFSKRENCHPVFFKPDLHFEWNKRSEQQLHLQKLALSEDEITPQFLYQISEDSYKASLEDFLAELENRNIKKAIFSRIKKETLDSSFDIDFFYEKMCNQYPKAFIYVLNLPGDGVWLGASPELLISYDKGIARTVALAGTLKINKNLPAPEWTRKEIDEHRLVENHIIKVCNDMDLKYEKTPVRSSSTGKVYHLKSDFSLLLDQKTVAPFLDKIHPTPAISGLPQDLSLDLIYETEKHQRGYYCGFLGWVDNPESFNLFINLRCMKKIDNEIFLFAGGGITPDSNIVSEWEETEVKMTTITDLLPKNLSYSMQ